jgi:hypothetical protein
MRKPEVCTAITHWAALRNQVSAFQTRLSNPRLGNSHLFSTRHTPPLTPNSTLYCPGSPDRRSNRHMKKWGRGELRKIECPFGSPDITFSYPSPPNLLAEHARASQTSATSTRHGELKTMQLRTPERAEHDIKSVAQIAWGSVDCGSASARLTRATVLSVSRTNICRASIRIGRADERAFDHRWKYWQFELSN